MTLLFIDSFDHYTTVLNKYQLTNAASIGAGGRNGTNGVTITEGSAGYVRKSLPSASTIIVGFAILLPPFQTVYTWTGYEGATAQNRINLLGDGSFRCYRGTSTNLGTSAPGVVTWDAWNYIEYKITTSNTVGYFQIRVNGNVVYTLSGVDSCASANEYINQFAIYGGSAAPGVIYDDLYICDDQGANNNDYLGDVKVEALFPDSSGTYAQWIPNGAASNYLCVDETPPDNDTTYCSATGSSLKDTLSMGDLASADGIIYGMQTLLYARKDDAGEVFIEPIARIGGNDYTFGTGAYSLGDSYIYYRSIEELNPSTSGSWALSDVNNIEFGYNRSA